VIVKTIVAAQSEVAPFVRRLASHREACYELFGFDLMLDQKLKAWLVEVNISPSLMGGSPLDNMIKGTLMADVFHVVGVPACDANTFRADMAAASRAGGGRAGGGPAGGLQ
jgi:tubulin polyglutamylase TTLL4